MIHRLKIRGEGAKPAWAVPLCGLCLGAVLPLHPVAELLWFQARGLDILAQASAFARGRCLLCAGLPGTSGIVGPMGAPMASKSKIEWVRGRDGIRGKTSDRGVVCSLAAGHIAEVSR
jgi:hypothetical protein